LILKKRPVISTGGARFCKNVPALNNSKAINELGYTPTPVRETLIKSIRWYRENGYTK